jgi:hypothetical protein
MRGIRVADYVIAAAGLLGHALLLLLLARRHLLRRQAAFAFLIAFYILRSVVFLMFGSVPQIYWPFIFLDPALQLVVMFVFGVAAWRRRHGIATALPTFLLLAGFVAWLIGPSSHFSPQILAIKFSIFVSTLWLQTAAVLWVLRKQAPQEARLSLGIALGFAAYSVVNIVTEAWRMHYALVSRFSLYPNLSYLRLAIYFCCLAAWSFLLWAFPYPFDQAMRQRERPGN